MNREQLKKHIELYKQTERSVLELDTKFGINIWDSKRPNFYNNYNLLIHNLLVNIFGDQNVDLLEEYIFEQSYITFDELCKVLKIDETNIK